MKNAEEKKLTRIFCLILIWTLFLSVTAAGLLMAAARTGYVSEGREAQTVTLTAPESE